MTAEALNPSAYPDLAGWDKKNRQLVYAMCDAGWTGRITSKRHWLGKAPDGTSTITVPSKDGNNRGLANATAQFMRWLKQHSTPEIQEIWEKANGEDDPLIRDTLVESLVKKQAEQIMTEKLERIVKQPAVTGTGPYLARSHSGKDGGVRYESETTLERHWNNGQTDYVCAFPGCAWDSHNPRSVAMHYGQQHTRKGESEPAGVGPLHPDPTYTEPVTSRYRPTERMVNTLMSVLDDILNDTADMRETAVRLLTWMNERPDIEHEARTLVPLTDKQVLDRIRLLVGQPDQSEELEALRAENLDLADEIVRLKDERRALRDLLTDVEE